MKTLYLPQDLRPELRKIWGVRFFGDKDRVLQKFKKYCEKKKFKKIITIGDYCSLFLPSDIKIFDKKIRRQRIKQSLSSSLTCFNPAGTIQKEVWGVLKKAIRENQNVFVEGEEDLLVIPTVLLSEKDTAVVYGLFDRGICLIEVGPEMKKKFKKILERFKVK